MYTGDLNPFPLACKILNFFNCCDFTFKHLPVVWAQDLMLAWFWTFSFTESSLLNIYLRFEPRTLLSHNSNFFNHWKYTQVQLTSFQHFSWWNEINEKFKKVFHLVSLESLTFFNNLLTAIDTSVTLSIHMKATWHKLQK